MNGQNGKQNNNNFNQFDMNINANTNELWTFAEISDILLNSLNALSKCKSKFDQLKVITNLLQNVID